MIEEIKRDDSEDYLYILKALNEIPFVVGKNLLIDFLMGRIKNKSITKNNLFTYHNFGIFSKRSEQDIRNMIENLISNKLIEFSNLSNTFLKVLAITSKGNQELLKPTLNKNKTKNRFNLQFSEVTENERKIFEELNPILKYYNEQQKKAIISKKDKILCIAGAGSGKTSVLVKRIEFLIKYKGVPAKEILAITFTRKAKQEMESRLIEMGIKTNVETFNSFTEKILRENSHRIYNRIVRVMSYSDKLFALSMALERSHMGIQGAIDSYFSENQKRGKEMDKLANIFLGDCYSIIEYLKSSGQGIYDFSEGINKDKQNAKIIYNICQDIMNHMEIQGLRDFTDQLLDCLKFFKENKNDIPKFQHILVDEYQDVNDVQIDLLEILKPENLFVVGDPRQSIFGWRGSNIDYIFNFQKEFPDAEIIGLNKNYRSGRKIVEFMNESILGLGLDNLEAISEIKGEIRLREFTTEQEEYDYIIKEIQGLNLDRNEIFVLSRTNRQLNELSQKLRLLKIPHIVKTDEIKKPIEAKRGEITLSTIHAIKGLEAKVVFVIGCNEQNFPCKASDHPILEFIKGTDSDKEEEEKRLFYVAISRAKEILYLSYSGKKPTYFITGEMKKIIENSDSLALFN